MGDHHHAFPVGALQRIVEDGKGLDDRFSSPLPFLPDRGFASIGYGVPGGIGAQLGVGKGRRVVSLTGDGGFNMSMGELETARRAIDVLGRVGGTPFQVGTYRLARGMDLMIRGDRSEALELFEAARLDAARVGHGIGELAPSLLAAGALGELGRTGEAASLLRRAAELAEGMGSSLFRCWCRSSRRSSGSSCGCAC